MVGEVVAHTVLAEIGAREFGGLVHVSGEAMHEREIQTDPRVRRRRGGEPAQDPDGARVCAGDRKRKREIVGQHEIIRRDFEAVDVALLGRLVIAELIERDAEAVQGVGVVRAECERAFEGRDRVRRPPRRDQRLAETHERVRIARRKRDRALVGGEGVGEAVHVPRDLGESEHRRGGFGIEFARASEQRCRGRHVAARPGRVGERHHELGVGLGLGRGASTAAVSIGPQAAIKRVNANPAAAAAADRGPGARGAASEPREVREVIGVTRESVYNLGPASGREWWPE